MSTLVQVMTTHRSEKFRTDIQFLRGVSISLVVAYHAELISFGYLGVDMFLTISGFVITTSLLGDSSRSASTQLKMFFTRRAKRILPPLFGAVLLIALISLLVEPLGSTQRKTSEHLVSALLFVANFSHASAEGGYFATESKELLTLHLWSLSLEEQFYVLFPLLVVVVARFSRQGSARRRLCQAVFPLLLASLVWNCLEVYLWSEGSGTRASFFMLQSRAWQFLVGSLVALIESRHRVRAGGVLAPIVLVAVGVLGPTSGGEVVGRLIVALLVVVVISGDGVSTWESFRITRLFVWLGDRSYSLYLVHWPLFVIANRFRTGLGSGGDALVRLAAVGFSLMIVVTLFHRLDNFGVRRNAGGQLRISLSVLVAAGFLLGSLWFQLLPKALPDLQRSSEAAWDRRIGQCEFMNKDNSATAICQSGEYSSVGRTRVMLVGDSMAGMLAVMLEDLAEVKQLDLAVSVRGACPFAPQTLYQYQFQMADMSESAKSCAERSLATKAFMRDWQPDIVIVVNRLHRYLVQPSGTPTTERTSEVWAALDEMLSETLGIARAVILVDGFPEFPEGSFVRSEITLLNLLLGRAESFVPSRSPEQLLERRINARLATKYQNRVVILDPYESLCEATYCQSSAGSRNFYFDDNHLTIDGANKLSPSFDALINSILGDSHQEM